MLFPYVMVRHRMGLMQAFVSYVFFKVWCNGPFHEYSIELFREFPGLFSIMEQLDREQQAGKDTGAGAFFYSHVNAIFLEFKELSPKQIKQLRRQFKSNNNIRGLCEGRCAGSRYPCKSEFTPLMTKINGFFSKLYSSGFFDLKIVKDAIGFELRDHYLSFARTNAVPCCPFCGLYPMDNEHDATREAYDHYLPASVYPFNSVNLKNLAPACYKCNSQYKIAKDPLVNEDGSARRAFYPYSSKLPRIRVAMRFLNPHGGIPENPVELDIELAADGYEEELNTWNSLYKIKRRYAAKSCGAAGGKQWLNRILMESSNYGIGPNEMLDAELLACNSAPWIDAGFLKAAFLEESRRVGLVPASSN